ncbi:MAG TPA: hypothetical protein VMY42_01575 [Thermoguttaceae bacterium]|nr:hypothetical protein [Thermoguttaceae bacterium]
MSRRKRRAAAGEKGPAARKTPRQAAADRSVAVRGRPVPRPGRPKPWFLAVTVLLQGAWIVFLLVLAVRG